MSTPLQVAMALHYWTRSDDYGLNTGDHNFDAPAVRDQRKQMVEAGLLIHCTEGSRNYRAGPALEYYIDAICAVPWPIQRWVIPDNPSLAALIKAGMA